MWGIGKGSEISGISELEAKTEDFLKIKPEESTTFDECKSFFDNLYAKKLDSEAVEEFIETNSEQIQEVLVNCDEIYNGISQESLEQGFENINIYEDTERLDDSLSNFEESNWKGMDMENRKESMSHLAEYVKEAIGFKDPPKIEYYNNPRVGDYGGYNASTNVLQVNEYMLYDSNEAADTIAHELWHAHQYECAKNPQSTRDFQYQYNFENYIPSYLDYEAYENQLLEAEARAFASQFKERLYNLQGGHI